MENRSSPQDHVKADELCQGCKVDSSSPDIATIHHSESDLTLVKERACQEASGALWNRTRKIPCFEFEFHLSFEVSLNLSSC